MIKSPFDKYNVELNTLEINVLIKIIQHNLPEGTEEELLIMGLYAKLKRKQEEIEKT